MFFLFVLAEAAAGGDGDAIDDLVAHGNGVTDANGTLLYLSVRDHGTLVRLKCGRSFKVLSFKSSAIAAPFFQKRPYMRSRRGWKFGSASYSSPFYIHQILADIGSHRYTGKIFGRKAGKDRF